MGPEETKAFQSEMDRIDTIYSAGPDFMKLPTFNFTGMHMFYVNKWCVAVSKAINTRLWRVNFTIGQVDFHITGEMNKLKIIETKVPTRPGKMRVHLENLEISWNFEKFNNWHDTKPGKTRCVLKIHP